DGVSDGQVHVDFPASSPYALACGGTKLLADAATGTVSSEVVWNELAANEGAGGGGVSDKFALPAWQADAGVGPRAASEPGAAAASGSGAGGSGAGSGSGSGSRTGGGAGCRTWRATPTRSPGTRSTPAGRPRWWAGPARSRRCGRR